MTISIRTFMICAGAALLAGCASVGAGPREQWEGEPVVRVRLVHTLAEIEGAAGREWTVSTDNGSVRKALPESAPVEFEATESGVAVSWHDAAGRRTEQVVGKMLVLESADPEDLLLLKSVPYGVGWWWESTADRTYSGRIEVRARRNGDLEIVCALPLEDYLLGVVPSEIGSGAPAEAMKAQAIAARSEVVTALRSRIYAGENHDICADVDCQVYSGNGKRTVDTDRAVWDTEALVLSHDGTTIGAYYASNCGGHSESVENVWPDRSGPVPYWSGSFDSERDPGVDLTKETALRAWLATEPDVWCAPSKDGIPDWAKKNFRWERTFTAEETSKAVASVRDIGTVVDIVPVERGVSGRLTRVEFVGSEGRVEVGPELKIRTLFAPPLKSAAFVVDAEGPEGHPDQFTLSGAGYGHGVGMCQTGAMARAAAGQTYAQILTAYYPEVEIGRSWKRADD